MCRTYLVFFLLFYCGIEALYCQNTDSLSTYDIYMQAREYYVNGEYVEAENLFNKATQFYRSDEKYDSVQVVWRDMIELFGWQGKSEQMHHIKDSLNYYYNIHSEDRNVFLNNQVTFAKGYVYLLEKEKVDSILMPIMGELQADTANYITYTRALIYLGTVIYFTRPVELAYAHAQIIDSVVINNPDKYLDTIPNLYLSAINTYGAIMYYLNFVDESLKASKKILEFHEEYPLTENNLNATLSNMASDYSLLGLNKEALSLHQKVEKSIQPNLLYDFYMEKGRLLQSMNRNEEAKKYFALSLQSDFTAESSIQKLRYYGLCLDVLGDLNREKNEYEDYVSKGEAIIEAFDIPLSQQAVFFTSAGDYFKQSEKYTEAILYLEKAKNALEKINMESLVLNYNEGLVKLADIYMIIEEFSKAEEYYVQSQSVFEDKNKSYFLRIQSSLAELYYKQQEFEKAMEVIDRNLANIDQFPINPYMPSLYYYKAKILADEDLDKAKTSILEGVAYVEKLLFSINQPDDLVGNYQDFEELIHLGLNLCYKTKDYDQLQYLMDFSKALVTRKSLLQTISISHPDIPSEVADSLRLLDKSIGFYKELISQQEEGSKEEVLYKKKLLQVISSKDALLEEVKEKYPRYKDFMLSNYKTNLQEIKNAWLNDQTTFVEYTFSDSSLYLLVVNQDQSVVKQIAIDTSFASLIKDYNVSMEQNNFAQYYQLAKKIYNISIAPVAPFLKENVIVVRDGALNYLNFETLPLKFEDVNGFNEVTFMIENHQFNYILSTSHQMLLDKYRTESNVKKGVFAPGFDWSTPSDDQGLSFLRQPFSVQLAEKLRSEESVEAYIRRKANKENFVANIERYGMIHLATHATIDEENPYKSRVYLAPDSTDGYSFLQMEDFYSLPLEADLIVLLGCETGVGKFTSGVGVQSLSHALSYAGGSAQIFTTWKVDEKASNEILEDFYEKDYQRDKVRALREAKLSFLQSHPNSTLHNPYYWGGLVLQGSISDGGNRWSTTHVIAGAGLLSLILFGASYYQRRRKSLAA